MSNEVEIQSVQRPLPDSRAAASKWDTFEPFVDEHVVAEFLGIQPRRVLEMARRGEIPAHPIGRRRMT